MSGQMLPFLGTDEHRKEQRMKLIRATRRTNGTLVLINLEHITAMQQETSEQETSETLHYTAIILHNGREIDVSESIEELLQPAETNLVYL